MTNLPGPGDPETWPAYTGHPNDPRRPDDVECPMCGGPTDADGCTGEDDECDYLWPEPDYEAMLDDGRWVR